MCIFKTKPQKYCLNDDALCFSPVHKTKHPRVCWMDEARMRYKCYITCLGHFDKIKIKNPDGKGDLNQ